MAINVSNFSNIGAAFNFPSVIPIRVLSDSCLALELFTLCEMYLFPSTLNCEQNRPTTPLKQGPSILTPKEINNPRFLKENDCDTEHIR